MRVSLKVLLIAWAGLFLIIGGLLVNAYSKLKPETFIALMTEQVQKSYPGAELKVEDISYGFSLDFNLHLKNIELTRSGKMMAKAGYVELKVPWWLLVYNKGNVQINLQDLDIFIDQSDVPLKKSGPILPGSAVVRVSLPAYLADADYTLRAKQISIKDIENSRRYFVVSKLLMRNFQHGKNSAFEINVPITIKHAETHYTSDLWLFGDVTPGSLEWQFNYRGEFRTKDHNDKFQIEDMVIGGKASFEPHTLAVNSEVHLSIDKNHIGTGIFTINKDSMGINLAFEKLPLSYFSFIADQIKNPYLGKLEGEAAGDFKFSRSFENAEAVLSGKVNFDGVLQLSENSNIPGKWSIGVNDSRWDISFMSPKGEASYFRRSVLDFKKATVTQYNDELGFTGLDLGLTIAPLPSLDKFMAESPGVYYTSMVSYNDCLVGDQVISGSFNYGVSPDQKYYQGDLAGKKSSFKLRFSEKNEQSALESKFQNFKWVESYQLLGSLFNAKNATLDGKVDGRWTTDWYSGDWLMQLKAFDLDSPTGVVPDFVNRTASLFDLDAKSFRNQNLNLQVKKGNFNLTSLQFENLEPIKISGPLKLKSLLTLSYPKNRMMKPIRKEVTEAYWVVKE